MIPRVRMARKRLGIARERYESTYRTLLASEIYPCSNDPAWHRSGRRWITWRAVANRKDPIA